MFARRYFAARYTAPRYFPQSQGQVVAVYAGRIEYTVGKSLVQYVAPAQQLDYKGKQ